jgi:putative lipoprotein
MWRTVAILALALSIPALAHAQLPDSVKWVGPDAIEIMAFIDAPEACYRAGAATAGAPPGTASVANAFQVTVPIVRTTDQMCAQVITRLMFMTKLAAAGGEVTLIVYTVNATAKAVSARALPLPPRPETPLGGTGWRLTHLGTEAVVHAGLGVQAASINFDAETGRFTGSGGCNRINGPYKLSGQSLTFGTGASTKMACVTGMDTEAAFLKALADTRSWRIRDTVLELLDTKGAVVARLARTR